VGPRPAAAKMYAHVQVLFHSVQLEGESIRESPGSNCLFTEVETCTIQNLILFIHLFSTIFRAAAKSGSKGVSSFTHFAHVGTVLAGVFKL